MHGRNDGSIGQGMHLFDSKSDCLREGFCPERQCKAPESPGKPPKIPVLAIVGPTAVGKSALALRLANTLGGEIVSADSRQVYRYMDIGTAKPSHEELAAVPHHLVDIVDPAEDYSLVRFIEDASEAIQNVNQGSKLPILAGGTGQYVWGLLEGWNAPEAAPNPGLRQRLAERMRDDGLEALYDELATRDPATASRIDPRNPRRVMRALEISYSSPAHNPKAPRKVPPHYEVKIIGLTLERSALYQRIDKRVDIMFESGWVDEVSCLLDRGFTPDLPSLSSLGYREIVQHIRNKLPLKEAITGIKHSTHRFARRQYAWFKPTDERIRWFDSSAGPEVLTDEIRGWLKARASL